jgi:hypothetical protein
VRFTTRHDYVDDAGTGGGVSTVPLIAKGGSFTVASADAGSRYNVASAAASIVTIPTNATDPIPVGSSFEVAWRGAGGVSFSPAAGVTLNSYGNYVSLARQWSSAVLLKVGTDEWDLVGDLA